MWCTRYSLYLIHVSHQRFAAVPVFLCIGMGKLRKSSSDTSYLLDLRARGAALALPHLCMAPAQGPACWGVYAAQLGQEIGADVLGCRLMRYKILGESRHNVSPQRLWGFECSLQALDTGVLYILRLYRGQRSSHMCKITENLHRPQSLLLWLVPERLLASSDFSSCLFVLGFLGHWRDQN